MPSISIAIKAQKEIDLLIGQDGKLYPIEFKKTARPGRDSTKAFSTLSRLKASIGHGGVLCLVEDHVPINRDVDAIPVSYL